MRATTRNRAITVTAGMLVVGIALTGCVPTPSTHEVAVAAARTSFDKAIAAIGDELPEIPDSGLREKIIDDGTFAGSASLIDADQAAVQAEGYGLTGLSSYILDVYGSDATPTLLLYVSGYAEGGGGLSYEKEVAYSCVAVTIELEAATLSEVGAPCTDDIYTTVSRVSEITFEELQAATPLQ